MWPDTVCSRDYGYVAYESNPILSAEMLPTWTQEGREKLK